MAEPERGLSSTNASFQLRIQDSNHEITLYKDNFPVLKAERGVTLGLLKLIYSSDEGNSGILLGVKPRVNDRIPCLITFDSTSLNHAEYDLIVQDVSGIETMPKAILQQNTQQDNLHVTDQLQYAQELTPSRETPPSSQITKPTTTSTKTRQRVNKRHRGPSTRTSRATPQAAPKQSVPTSMMDFDEEQMAEEMIGKRYQSPSSPQGGGEVSLKEKEQDDEPPEPDSTGNPPEEFHFVAEDYGFDINLVSPTQTDKGVRWPCYRCGKDYFSAAHLRRHWIIHTSFRPYQCNVCEKRFPFNWDLKKHMTRHTGNKRFKCPSCPKSFNTRSELKCHNWLHTGRGWGDTRIMF